MSDDLPIKLPPVDPSAAGEIPGTSLSPELLAGLLADGDDELAAWTLRHALEETSRAAVFDGLLRDAMALVGERWRTGQWSIAEEHLASRTLLRTLERIRPELGPEHRVGPMAVLAGVAGEQHMIGLACLEQVLAEAGWTVSNLGADLPAADLGAFVRRNDVSLVALSAVDPARAATLAESVRAAREASGGRGIPVVIGGQIAAHEDAAATVGADGAVRSLSEALAFAEAHRPPETSGPGAH
ncbi:MAG TPA: cobalamin-dependent protein [Candidatus Limnocylindrales bacterium]|nr:cobalamin-dependent protein [Candidatus Limnocylindrales bacterium]